MQAWIYCGYATEELYAEWLEIDVAEVGVTGFLTLGCSFWATVARVRGGGCILAFVLGGKVLSESHFASPNPTKESASHFF